MTVDEIIARVKARANGRTMAMDEEPFWDEVLVAEIDRLRAAVKSLNDFWPAKFWATLSTICSEHPVIDEVAAKGVNHETAT